MCVFEVLDEYEKVGEKEGVLETVAESETERF